MTATCEPARIARSPRPTDVSLLPVPEGLVVLTFDDGVRSCSTFVAPLLRHYGFGATFFITEGLNFADKEHYLTWEQVRGLHDAGFEIGNHTRNHYDVRRQSRDELRADIAHIAIRCQEYGIPRPTTFCYPGYSNCPDAVSVLAKDGFLFARRGFAPEFPLVHTGGRGPVYDPSLHHPLLVPTTNAFGPTWGFEDLVWAVDQARGGKAAVLVFHGVPDLEHPWVYADPVVFERCMAYLHNRGCTVIAMRDLVRYVDQAVVPPDPNLSSATSG